MYSSKLGCTVNTFVQDNSFYNYTGSPTLRTGYILSPTTKEYHICRSVLRFANFPLPAGETVIQAVIYLRATSDSSLKENLKLYRKTSGIFDMTHLTYPTLLLADLTKIADPADTNHASNMFYRSAWNAVSTTDSAGVARYNCDFVLWEKSPAAGTIFCSRSYPAPPDYTPYIVIQYTQPPSFPVIALKQEAYNRVGISWNRIENTTTDYGGVIGAAENNLDHYSIYRAIGNPLFPDTDPDLLVDPIEYQYIGQTTADHNYYYDYGAQWNATSWRNAGFAYTRYWYKIKAVWKIGATEYESSFSVHPQWIDGSSVLHDYIQVIDAMPHVQRFLIRDLEGYFPDYVFEINPTEYTPCDTESVFQEKIALSGRRGMIKFDRQPESRQMSWDRIHRTMFNELRNRYLSGHTFYLYDHNDEELVGVLDEFDFDEIVATVPSDYKGSLTLKGIGKPEDTNYVS